jgi:hypothetical protein
MIFKQFLLPQKRRRRARSAKVLGVFCHCRPILYARREIFLPSVSKSFADKEFVS